MDGLILICIMYLQVSKYLTLKWYPIPRRRWKAETRITRRLYTNPMALRMGLCRQLMKNNLFQSVQKIRRVAYKKRILPLLVNQLQIPVIHTQYSMRICVSLLLSSRDYGSLNQECPCPFLLQMIVKFCRDGGRGRRLGPTYRLSTL